MRARWAGLLATGGVLAMLAPLLSYGLDITDGGFHLANQDGALQLGAWGAVASPFWWLSDWLGGLWMRLTEGWGILGTRWGWALALAATAGLGCHAVARAFGGGAWLVPAAWLAGLHGALIPVMVPDNYVLPALLGTGCCAAFSAGAAASGRARLGLGLLAGMLLAVAAGARLPMILLAGLPVGHALLLLWRGAPRTALLLPTATLAGAGAGLAGLAAWIAAAGAGPAVMDAAFGLDTLSGDGEAVGGHFLAQARQQAATLAGPGAMLLALAGATAVVAGPASRRWAALAGGLALAAALGWAVPIMTAGAGRFHGLPVVALLAWAGLGLPWLWRHGPAAPEAQLAVFLSGPVLAVAMVAGSSLGLLKLSYGMAVLFPLVVALARGTAPWALAAPLLVMGGHGSAIAWAHLLSPATGYVYGDLPRAQLAATYPTGRLRGLATQPGRVVALEEALAALAREGQPGEVLLAYSGIGLMHYAARMPPPLGLAVPDYLPPRRLERRLAALCAAEGEARPRLVLRSLTQMPGNDWGTERSVPAAPYLPGPFWARNRAILDAAVEGPCGAVPVWANRDFELLRTRP